MLDSLYRAKQARTYAVVHKIKYVVLRPLLNLDAVVIGNGAVWDLDGFVLLLELVKQVRVRRHLLLKLGKVHLRQVRRKAVHPKRICMFMVFLERVSIFSKLTEKSRRCSGP